MNIVWLYFILCFVLAAIAITLIYRITNTGNRKLADRIAYGFIALVVLSGAAVIAIILVRPGKDEYVKDGTFFLTYEHKGVYYDHLIKVQRYKTVPSFWSPCILTKEEISDIDIKYEEKEK